MKNIVLGSVLILGTISGFSNNAQANDNYCREYTKTIIIGDQKQVGYGTACLQPDGDWKIMKKSEQVSLEKHSIISYAVPQKIVYQPIKVSTKQRHRKKNSKRYAKMRSNDRNHIALFTWR